MEIRGRGSQPTKFRGRVRLVRGRKDFRLVQAGDVVVSATADPEMVELLDRAGAVVTDVGGLLSHLVVVARERGVVVVVGTRFATSRLVDGESVMVDGRRGLVLRTSEAKLDL